MPEHIYTVGKTDTDWNVTLPVYFRTYEIGHNIGLLKKDPDSADDLDRALFFKVVNRKQIAPSTRAVASADLPAAAASVKLNEKTNWKEWLKASDDGLSFYNLLLGFVSNRYVEWEITYPASNLLGSIRTEPAPRFTSSDSPYENPRLNITTWNDVFPNFTLYNQSQYTLATLGLAKARAIGHKYSLAKLDSRPATPVDYVVLGDVSST